MSHRRLGYLWQFITLVSALMMVVLLMGFIRVDSSSIPTFFAVNTEDDDSDSIPDCSCSTSLARCSLRAAIQSANACAGAQTIKFTAPWYISVTSQLPTLTDNSTIISATDKWMTGGPIPFPGVVLDGGNGSFDGLVITASHCAVYGIQIINFGYNGVLLKDGASFNDIGGSGYRQRNIISKNNSYGVRIEDASTTGNYITYNYIGTNPEGNSDWGNGFHGIGVSDAEANTISYNLISGNTWSGVGIDFVHSLLILHNQIGLDVSKYPLGNDYYGIHVANDSDPIIQQNTIGFNGRGIYVDGGSNPTIFKNSIYSNTASTMALPDGGGVLIKGVGTTASIDENDIFSNTARYGGGLAVEEDAYAWVYHNLFQNNQALKPGDDDRKGGGIYIGNSGALVKWNRIYSNTVPGWPGLYPFSFGGGICLYGADDVEISENEIRGNRISGNAGGGGGIYLFEGGKAKILRNSITKNTVSVVSTAGSGIEINNDATGSLTWVEGNWVSKNVGGRGAVQVIFSDYVTLTNNVIANNGDPGLYIDECGDHNRIIHNTIARNTGSGIVLNNAHMDFYNNIVVLNNMYGIELLDSYSVGETRNDVWGNALAASNIETYDPYLDVDPQFFDANYDVYAIRSTSACIDDCDYSHTSNTSFNKLSRPQGASCDIGAYEMALPIYLPIVFR